ncbi:hypothetical protein M0802_009170 [Mischocyttarus mexicanus]|nr:hypothetical protein M0802_009170 [Mischocyttarus mexicanus]
MWWAGGSCDLQRCKFLVLLTLIGCSEAYLNIFISESQVMKFMDPITIAGLKTTDASEVEKKNRKEGKKDKKASIDKRNRSIDVRREVFLKTDLFRCSNPGAMLLIARKWCREMR